MVWYKFVAIPFYLWYDKYEANIHSKFMPTTYDSDFHINNIVEKYGKKLDADMVKAYCDDNPIGYQTITKFLNRYKTK